MSTNMYKEIAEDLMKRGIMQFVENATQEQILLFETTNGITLPSDYKDWLTYSDGGEFFLPAGIQLYGVAHKPLIDVNDDDRPNENYIVIGALASGDPVLCEKSNQKISIYDHEAGIIHDDETYPDFNAFLNDLYNLLGIGG